MQSSVTLKLDSSLVKRAKARARQRGISLSALVEESLRAYLEGKCR
jgi:predicted HicB family RNase H-like nuclease